LWVVWFYKLFDASGLPRETRGKKLVKIMQAIKQYFSSHVTLALGSRHSYNQPNWR